MASTRQASMLILALVIAGCGAATPPSLAVPSSAAASSAAPTLTTAPSPSGTQASAVPSITPPAATGTPDPSIPLRQQANAALATLRDPKLAAEFRISGSVSMSGQSFTSSGRLVVAGPDIELALRTEELNVLVSEVAKGGKVWLRVGEGRWLLDEAPSPPPALASAFPATVAVEASGAVYRDAERLERVRLNGADLNTLLTATGMADPGTTGSTGGAFLLLARDGRLAGLELELTFAAAKGQPPETIARTLSIVRVARIGDAGAPAVATPRDAWIRHQSERLAYLVSYPPTMRLSVGTDGDVFKGPSTSECVITGTVVGSKDTSASITKSEVARLAKAGVTVVANRAVTVAGDPARRLELKFQSGGKSYWAAKYIVIHKEVAYTLSWFDLATRRAALEKVLGEMLASFAPMF